MTVDTLATIGRTEPLFDADLSRFASELDGRISASRFLVIGGAGSIGQAVTRELFARSPAALHVVDVSENNLVELVRDIRSTLGYIKGDFQTYAIDCGSRVFDAFVRHGAYDYVLNLSALKHVRSEKDPYTLMRMIEVNILNVISSIQQSAQMGAKKYFCVSTDKAANPVSMMGASKRIMEMFLLRAGPDMPISTARFANVAFSDGSLLHGFNQRILKRQPISAPSDVRRYFVTAQEAGQLCMLSTLLGKNGEIFFPKLSEKLHLITFAEIAMRYLRSLGYEAAVCDSEEEARADIEKYLRSGKWPCYFFNSDTSGEKDFEEFYTEGERVNWDRFVSIGVVENLADSPEEKLENFRLQVLNLLASGSWDRADLVRLFHDLLPGFAHKDTGKFLDGRM
jgi:UDP-N-acetylglucosamine 4,6-dehydratase